MPAPTSKPRDHFAARSDAKSRASAAIARRSETDEMVKGWWMYLLVVSVAFGLAALVSFVLLVPGFEGWAIGYLMMYIAGIAILSIFNYKQARRLTDHFRREAELRQGVIDYMEAVAGTKGRETVVAQLISEMRADEDKEKGSERIPNPLYAAMSILPLIGIAFELYYLHALNGAPEAHERRWTTFLGNVNDGASRLELGNVPQHMPVMRKRGFLAYVVLTFLFFPFLAYWYLSMLSEVNAHFASQSEAEHGLEALLS